MSCARERSRSGASLDPVLELRDQLQMLAEREGAVDPLLADEPALLIEPRGSDLRLDLRARRRRAHPRARGRAPDRTTRSASA